MNKRAAFLLTGVFLILQCLSAWAQPQGQPAVPAQAAIRRLDQIFNFPFTEETELHAINQLCRTVQPVLVAHQEWTTALDRIAAFTAIAPGEKWLLVSFAQSDDRALRKLRDEIHLPVPAGGALVRMYPTKADLPPAIRAMFSEDVAGINWDRFIAVLVEDHADKAVADTISHELTHAWIAALTAEKPALPKWFNEGVAEYLSRSQAQYSGWSGNLLWREQASDEYHEFLLTFQYLEAVLGKQGCADFIRESVLHGVPAAWADYSKLRTRAQQWQAARERKVLLAGVVIVLLGLTLLAGRRRRHWKQQQARAHKELVRADTIGWQMQEFAVQSLRKMEAAETEEEFLASQTQVYRGLEARALAFVKEGRVMINIGQRKQAEQKLLQALQTAPWSGQVQTAVQCVRNEMHGIHL